jgi:hypothetical protein
VKITATVKKSLDNAIQHVQASAAGVSRDQLLEALTAARRHAEASALQPLQRSDGLHGADEMYLSLSAAAMEDFRRQHGSDALIGPEQFETNDPGWIACLLARLTSARQPFPTGTPTPIPIGDDVRFAIAGDWGTGNAAARSVGNLMMLKSPDISVHLGDVYYCGTAAEEKRRFVDVWPAGSSGSFALNSNHEMYSGGEGYFTVALPHGKFSRQCGVSYFALYNKEWLVLGFDSAYDSSNFLYQTGRLNQPQINFAGVTIHTPGIGLRPDGSRKRLLVFTHHDAIHGDGTTDAGLMAQMTIGLGGLPDAWYWGHDHVPAAFAPRSENGVVMHARCVGHGGVPYAPAGLGGRLWTETALAHDMDEPERALNGFVLLDLHGKGITDSFLGEDGSVRFASSY